MKKIDLNVDIAEGYEWDIELMQYATSVNICTGFHAGSIEITQSISSIAGKKGLRIGGHPGYPDREGFGRRNFEDSGLEGDLLASVIRQFSSWNARLDYIKPHGAFYSESAVGHGFAGSALVALLVRHRRPLMGLSDSFHKTIAETVGVPFITEGFADRRYQIDGSLLPRTEPNAMLKSISEKVEQALHLAPKVDSICLHGDESDCVDTIKAVRAGLESAGYEVGY